MKDNEEKNKTKKSLFLEAKNKVGLKNSALKGDNLRCYVIECENTKKNMAKLVTAMQKDKENSERLAKELEKFKLAIDNVSDHIIITDPSAKIIYMNKAVETTTGYSPKEAIGKHPFDLWGGYMNKDFYKKLWNTIKIHKKKFLGEITNQRKNGEKYIVDCQIIPITNSNGEIVFYLGIERDITRIKEVEKMKSEFVTVTSHQLRTPLTSIKWYVQFLLQEENGPLNKNQKSFVEQILSSNEKMIKLINDILNVAHIETGMRFSIVKEKKDVIEILKQVFNEQAIIAESKKIKIIFTPSLKGKMRIPIDPEKIQQVFQNLMSNAIKYSFLGKKIFITYQKKGRDFIFSIKDQGLGIRTNQQNRVFEKFFRAENILALDTDGTGLGLYISKAIIEGHGGKIWFTSKENQGSTFFLSLPLDNSEK